ncbi:alpha-tectorin-like isoform X1 [Siphateles boraxobius]|uniref:alpha-tectorin-like isoform X1 n=1 Tax=Siphateles boraxobius TaxID=180520 RepID=UPI0040630A25
MDIRMSETCVSSYTCNTYISLWLNDPHPQIEDGVVIRDVCGGYYWGGCCDYKTKPIRVKACPGNYYVYELVNPQLWCSGYCTDVNTISQAVSTVSPDIFTGSSITLNYDPCNNYNILDNYWRSTLNYWYMNGLISGHDDTRVEWDGWYRLFINGSSAQMPEWCMSYLSCGGYSSLWLNGSHPLLEDGVVTCEVYGSHYDQCSRYRSDPIQVKACPGNYYVYKFTRPTLSIPAPVYCAVSFTTPSIDPCYNYTSLDQPWRSTDNSYNYGKCDYNVEWNGWYRMFYNDQSVQMPESCVNQGMCGTSYPLWLNGPHPQLEDGVVTRQICVSSGSGCCTYTSHPIRVKACPGNYHVYEIVKPPFCCAYCVESTSQSIPSASTTTETIPSMETITPPITTTVAFQSISSDPCYNYESLDRPWRANNESGDYICDERFSWNGWYRLLYYGMDIRMSETCVSSYSCNTYISLWLNDPHPQIEDGVVIRDVCGGYYWGGCCDYKTKPIRVKACPGNYYVYELVKQEWWCTGYCTDVDTISQAVSTISPDIFTGSSITLNYDPCNNYNALDNYWRSTLNYWSMYGYISGQDDTRVEWDGWYRLFINGSSAQMPEWCFNYMSCGSFSSLWLNGSHPRLEDGVVTREVYGSRDYQCSRYRSDPIQVKACPGNYYVYQFTRPTLSIPAPVYCAVPFSTPIDDPCYSYTSLDEPWRSTDNYYYNNYYYYGMCDYNVEWNGWYRMFYNGQNTQMPESCVNQGMCGTYEPLWLNDPHPQLEDGVVTRQVCVSSWNGCCTYNSHPIRVKACPGNYYVYEFVKPIHCGAYCVEASSQSISSASTTTETIPSIESITHPITTTAPPVDPCHNYNILDDSWRATNNQHSSQIMCDAWVSWTGWYRLFIQGQSVQMPDTCVDEYSCGTHAPLWLNGSHPTVEDGVVTRDVCGHWSNNCCYFQSNPIKVKACPGDYYVYEFVSPTACSLVYCADSSNINTSTTTVMPTTMTDETTTTETTTMETTTDNRINIRSQFYPFGHGDSVNGRIDDGSSSVINLQQPFIFFGQTYNQIYVNNNGHLTFDGEWYSYSPYQFPAYGGKDLIAPFWTDIDNRWNGVISYQQYTSGSVLTQATQDINQYFSDLTFSASWVFVATWDRVAYYSNSGTETSFQVVLISNGHLSFVVINYGAIAPTQRYVQAGYDTIDSSHHFSITGSLQNDITSLPYSSNVNVPGRWAFRTDHGTRGCQFNGFPVQLGDSFWSDATCQQRCSCTRSGIQCSFEPCTYSQACRPAAFQYSCQNIQRQTCSISGDPHYYTFDNQIFHFQGTCTYVLSEACENGLPYYRIEGKNEHRGSTRVSWTRMVRVFVYNEEIELVKGHYYEAKVNGTFLATPFTLHNGSIQVYQSGFSLVISTDFGLLVTYDAYSYVTISVPYDYQNATCGLCGNYNLHPEDDFRSVSGEILSSDVDFANSWKAEGDTDPECHNVRCTGLACAVCTSSEMSLYSDTNHCGILGDVSGPFASCHSVFSPQTYIENCVYDLCLGGGYQPILCQALNVYSAQCQQQGVQLGHWRQPGFCEILCPERSHFESLGTSCPATCSNPSAPINCPLPNQESCICDNGYILSAGQCVPEMDCGCTFEGFYYSEGQSVVLDEDCGRQCVCRSRSMVCYQHQCDPAEVCGHHNGVRGCRPISYATCSVEGLGSYHTFDGQTFRYPGACGLTLARVMGPSQLPYFVLAVEKVPRGLQDFSRFLNFEAGGTHVSIELGEGSNVQVDGQMVGLPISVGSSQIHIYHSSVRGFVLETNFGVIVRADWPHIVRITAPTTYNGTLGGLCGNLNGNIGDEFYSPDGVLLDDSQLFADSWRDGSLSAHCEDTADIWEPGLHQNRSEFSELCNIMTMNNGPFAECSRTLDPWQRIEDCIQLLEQTEGAREALCEALRGYTLQCQQNGIAVGEWRSITHCDPNCPANTHFELCGTSCPASCPSLSFPFQCALPCQGGCQCNDGLVLDGDRCVPPTGCGCHYHGRYRQPGEQFWHGEECQFQCVCDGITGNVRCTPSSCSDQEICRVVEGEYGCHPRPHGSCYASGDPHYISFDRTYFDFQGTCRYVLATVCDYTRGLPHFQVEARNEAWNGWPVSITVEVFVNVSGHLVHMSQDMNGYSAVKVDEEIRNLPVYLDSGRVSVYSTGQFVYVSTDFGFSVSYGGSWEVKIVVPADYSGVTCGICGNFNGHPEDDFLTPSGALALSVDQFGAEWMVEDDMSCNHGCGDHCPLCQDESTTQAMCEIIRDNQGPFSFCHGSVDPQAYFNNCVFDVCISGNHNNVLCRSVQSYVSACQSVNTMVYPWRQLASCVMDCSSNIPNSHYEVCGTDCGHTCASSIDASCEHTCSEGCFCDEGFVRSGGLCVPVEQCGCLYDGFYYQIGEQFWDSTCSQRCQCFAPNDLRCTASFCPAAMECMVRNGRRDCFSPMSTCTVWGDPHYITFDGAVAHFQGTCSYEIAQTCGNVTDSDLQFRVVATNRHRGNMVVSFVSAVDVWLSQHEQHMHISIGQNRRVKVDGNAINAPAYQINDLVEVHEEQGFVILNAFNEFIVHFDGHSSLLVRVSERFYGSLCGMCGNFNGNPADDKVLPSGELASDDISFGHSWKSDTSIPGCGARDQTGNVDECPSRQRYSDLCSIITNTSGPFQNCHLHVDPAPYYYSCVYDLCLYTRANGMLCSAVEAYETACAILEIQIPEWRSGLRCDVRDRCSELSCSEDEWCGKKNGVYGCLCNEDHHRPQPDSFDFSETCESSSGSMSVSRCQLFEAGFPADVLHLNDPSCKGTVRNGRVEFHFDNDEHICGTNLVANGTHFIYDNFILGTPRSEGLIISREKILRLSFSCAYPQSQTLSMNVEINPLESIVHKTLPAGEGRYQVRMIPYEDDEFTRPFTGRVNAELDQEMHVEVRVEGVDSRQFALVMDTCWATPVNDPDYSLRWDLILSECPNPNDDTVDLLQNGVSTSSRFSFRMFIFTANSTKLYLHCAVHLCLLSSNRCSMDCDSGHRRREGRSLDFHDSASISMGPLVLSEGNTDKWVPEQVKVSEASSLCVSLMLILVPLMSVLLTHF